MSTTIDITDCDREPIHIPGSIQPHGVMLVVDPLVWRVTHAAGDVGRLRTLDWRDATVASVIGAALAEHVRGLVEAGPTSGFVGTYAAPNGEAFDVSAHGSADHLLLEFEPSPLSSAPAAAMLGRVAAAAAAFARTANRQSLCERAAVEFRLLTGFDRVMIYHFLGEGAGAVLAEDKVDDLPTFLNHQFPGSDIPRQARALYVRNLVRVIPDVCYTPAPLQPAWTDPAPLDLSDSALRSVSPIHLQYMKNMGIGASASISIVRDGVLWGLIACHNRTPRALPYDIRAACALLAGDLARQIEAKEDAERYRERIRLRAYQDSMLADLVDLVGFDLDSRLGELSRVLPNTGMALVRGMQVSLHGQTPTADQVATLTNWALGQGVGEPLNTDELSKRFAPALDYTAVASGVLALVLSAEEPVVLLWFRAEKVEVVNWAGNPHKAVNLAPGEKLSPRASFEAWSETVRGRSDAWSLAEVEAASRFKAAIHEQRQRQRLEDLNRTLNGALTAQTSLVEQKDFLLREVNHRVQNSLQLVSAFLGLQAKSLDGEAQTSLAEAQRRLSAVALVHRRLYRSDQIEVIDMARYLEELVEDIFSSMGPEWARQVRLDLAPIMVVTDRAVTLGLILTELVINADKYAYDGAAGPIEISLGQIGDGLRLTVADSGRGKLETSAGFGTRMMAAMVHQLRGDLQFLDNKPGLRAVLTAPIAAA